MRKYNTKSASCGQTISTLGGDYALKWDEETQMNVSAHAALLSQFAKAGSFFDRLVETCPMRLTSNNAPEVRDLIATVMVSMANGATRFRHCDRLHGDTATAELFGVGRFMSCDSVRRNFASIPDGKALPWVWRENLRLLQDVVAEDYVANLDPTVKPLYGHQEGAEFGYNPQKPGRPSHCYHALCIAKLWLTLAVVVHPGNETSGTHSRSMLAEYLEFVSAVKKPRLVRGDVSFGNESVIGDCEEADVRHLFKTKRSKAVRRAFCELLSDAGAWRDSYDGWQCAERDIRLDSWEKARRMVFARRPAEKIPKRKKPHRRGSSRSWTSPASSWWRPGTKTTPTATSGTRSSPTSRTSGTCSRGSATTGRTARPPRPARSSSRASRGCLAMHGRGLSQSTPPRAKRPTKSTAPSALSCPGSLLRRS